MWCHDDHQFRLPTCIGCTSEELTEDRNVAEPRHLIHRVAEVILEKACHREALAVHHFDGGLRFAAGEGVYLEAVRGYRKL